ncbi:cadherin domain-containing protein [Nocardioides sp.]|uniref:cadherin domain-containing protein n=1 Tax=Nocardioides sp. TaxID=35761 RepID=UPI0035620FA3
MRRSFRALIALATSAAVVGLQPAPLASASRTAAGGLLEPPSITLVAAGDCGRGGRSGSFLVDLHDPDTAVGDLVLSATSSNRRLLPSSTVRFGGSGVRRTVLLATKRGKRGASTVRITVSDGSSTDVTTIRVRAGNKRGNRLNGTRWTDLLLGQKGKDVLNGRRGIDLLCGGGQRDVLIGGPHADHFDGGPGRDRERDYNPAQGDTSADAPRLRFSPGVTEFVEGSGGVRVDPGVMLTGPRRTKIARGTVRITTGREAGDFLAVTDRFGIRSSFDASTGVLDLRGRSSLRRWRTVLRSLRFDTASATPHPFRTLTLQVVDKRRKASNRERRYVFLTDLPNAPEDLSLDSATVDENEPVGTAVGTVSAVDSDTPPGDLTFGFAPGGADNGEFTLDGTTLRTAAVFDAETRSSYEVRLRVTDPEANEYEESFTIEVQDVNDAPTDISLSPDSVEEGQPIGTVVGTLTATDQDSPADPQTFALVSGAGDADNGSFSIVGDELVTDEVFDFATKSDYSIRVQADDGQGGVFARGLSVSIDDVNLPPSDLDLSATTVDENEPVDTLVGLLTATDPDPGDTHTFSLVPGAGDSGNAAFDITTDELRTADVLDHEASSSLSIRVQAEDSGGETFAEPFTITVQDVNEAPTDLGLTGSTVAENQPSGTAVGTLSSTDPDAGDSHTYTLASGTGDDDNSGFQIAGAALETATGFDFESTPTLSVRVRSTDAGGLTFEKQFTITVTDANDPPVADDDSFTGTDRAIGNAALVVDDPTDGAPDPAGPQKTISGEILDGDTDPDAGDTLSVVAETVATNDGGSVEIQSDGDFVFHPAPGTSCSDTSDFFDYTLTDSVATDVGRVTIEITECVWFVDNDAPGNAGTSVAPFDSLAQAQVASGPGHTIFVHGGDGTPTGLGDGIDLQVGQRLIGQASALQVDGVTLEPADPAARPVLTDGAAHVVTLSSDNTVRGLELDPAGGGGIAGGLGVADGLLDDLVVDDTGSPGTAAGIDLDSTTGTFTFSDLTVDTVGAPAVRLTNAGTTIFQPAGTISLETTGAAGLDVSGTGFGGGSVVDDITVTGSSAGGISLVDTTGTIDLGDGIGPDLALSTGGTSTGLLISNAGAVTVPASGIATIDSTGGPAVDVGSTTGVSLSFDSVSSNGSNADGISLSGLGAGTFSATSGTLSGFSGTGVDLEGGSGSVSYGGTVGDGVGLSVEVTDRAGGDVVFSGPVTDSADAGGGIRLSTNNAGSTTFSGTPVVLDTGASDAVAMLASDGHTLVFSGGGIDIDTTSGTGFEATSSGEVSVSGSGNTITTTTGPGIDLAQTDILAAGVTFESISTDGASSGIRLDETGFAGGLEVTGSGTPGSGGTIQGSTGPGILLTRVGAGVDLTRVHVTGGADDGLRGTEVVGLSLSNSQITDNGDQFGEHGLDLTDLTGTMTLDDTTVTGSAEDNVHVENDTGDLDATVTDGTIGSNSSTTGNDGILLRGTGDGSMSLEIQRTTFTNNRGDHVQMTTDASTTVVQELTINDTTMTTTSPDVVGGGITVNPGGSAVMDAVLTDNEIQGAYDSAIVIDGPGSAALPQAVQIDATVTGNTIGTPGAANSGSATGDTVTVNSNGGSAVRVLIADNRLRQFANPAGINLTMNDGNSDLDATVRDNTISNPGSFGSYGVFLRSGSTGGTETSTTCLDLGHPSDPALKNALTGSGAVADIRVRRLADTSIRLPGYAGTAGDTAAVNAYLQGRNDLGGTPTVSTSAAGTGSFLGTGTCALPTP